MYGGTNKCCKSLDGQAIAHAPITQLDSILHYNLIFVNINFFKTFRELYKPGSKYLKLPSKKKQLLLQEVQEQNIQSILQEQLKEN